MFSGTFEIRMYVAKEDFSIILAARKKQLEWEEIILVNPPQANFSKDLTTPSIQVLMSTYFDGKKIIRDEIIILDFEIYYSAISKGTTLIFRYHKPVYNSEIKQFIYDLFREGPEENYFDAFFSLDVFEQLKKQHESIQELDTLLH
jgi:hypothetical protein